MTDEAKALVEQLRDHARNVGGDPSFERLYGSEAVALADLIETQAREIERLREALEVIRDGDYPYKQASQYAHEALRMKQWLTLKS